MVKNDIIIHITLFISLQATNTNRTHNTNETKMTSTMLHYPVSKTALQLFREEVIRDSSDKLILLQFRVPCSSDDPIDGYKQHEKQTAKVPLWLELPISGVHELYGASGTGKTQVALNLCIQAALSGQRDDHVRCVYLCLNGSNFVSRAAQRLSQMASMFTSPCKSSDYENIRNGNVSKCASTNDQILRRISLRGCMNTDDLFNLLETDLPLLMRQPLNDVRLLVIDSVSDLFRGNIDCSEESGTMSSEVAALRASMLFRLTSILKSMSDQFHPLSILIVNQATADFAAVNRNSNPTGSAIPSIKPALGLSWSYCVNSSFCLSKSDSHRTITLMKSSRFNTDQSNSFVIEKKGCFVFQT